MPFHIYLLCTPECHCLLEGSLHMAGAPFFMSGNPAFAAITQETPLNFLTVRAKRVHVLGALELITRDSVLSRLPLWGHQTVDWNAPPVFLRKKSMCLSRSFILRGRFWFGTLVETCGAPLREHKSVVAISALSPSASSSFIFQKEPYSLFWCPDFCSQETLLHCPVLMANKAYACGFHRMLTNGESY